MNAGVGASGPGHPNWMTGQPAERLFQLFLNRDANAVRAAALALETEVGRAVILDGGPKASGFCAAHDDAPVAA